MDREYRKVGKGENAWWTGEIKKAIEVKRRKCKDMLQRNADEEIRERRRKENKSWNRKVEELVKKVK